MVGIATVLTFIGSIAPLAGLVFKYYRKNKGLKVERGQIKQEREELEQKKQELLENIEEKEQTIEDVREAISTLAKITQGEETDDEKLKDVLDNLEQTVLPTEQQLLSRQNRLRTQLCQINNEIEQIKEGETDETDT